MNVLNSVNFLWIEALWLLALLPLLVLLYMWLLRRRKKAAVAWSSLAIIKEAMGQQRLWRRHVPPALMLLAVASLIVATSRPTAVITLSSENTMLITPSCSSTALKSFFASASSWCVPCTDA